MILPLSELYCGSLEEDIELKEKLEDAYKQKPYIVTTQNLRYLEKTGAYQAKRAFCILGSGDPIIEMATRKPLDLTAVDINPHQKAVFSLKMASLQGLNNKEMESFLYNYDDEDYYNYEMFKKIFSFFKEEDTKVRNFWNKAIKESGPLLIEFFIKGGLELQTIDKIRMAIPFLKKKFAFIQAEENLKKSNIRIETADAISWLLDHPEEKFDYIDITNILLFVYQLDCANNVDKFRSIIEKLQQIYERNLEEGGTFVLDYMFGTEIKNLGEADSHDNASLKHIYAIYLNIYQELQKAFEIETFVVENVLSFYDSKVPVDTIIMTKKR